MSREGGDVSGCHPRILTVIGCGQARVQGVPAELYPWSSRGGRGRGPAGRTPFDPSAPPWPTPSIISTNGCTCSIFSITLRCETGRSGRRFQTWQVSPLSAAAYLWTFCRRSDYYRCSSDG